MKKITLTVDRQKLQGIIFYPEKVKEKNPAILFFNGWRSNGKNALRQAELLAKHGFICMTFTMRGHGISEGDLNKLTKQDFLNDAICAYNSLIKQKGVDADSISIVGSSFGAYMAALMSKEKKILNLVLRVPANYPNESFNHPQINFSSDNNPSMLQWRFKSLGTQETFALEALHKFTGNILIIQSENDELVPFQTVENYINACTKKIKLTHIIMKGADHRISTEKSRAEYDHILINWFKDKR